MWISVGKNPTAFNTDIYKSFSIELDSQRKPAVKLWNKDDNSSDTIECETLAEAKDIFNDIMKQLRLFE